MLLALVVVRLGPRRRLTAGGKMRAVVQLDDAGIRVILSGWDRALTLRRTVEFATANVKAAFVTEPSSLEPSIDHRFWDGAHTTAPRAPTGGASGRCWGEQWRASSCGRLRPEKPHSSYLFSICAGTSSAEPCWRSPNRTRRRP